MSSDLEQANNLIREEFLKIELWSRPLKRSKYSYGDVRCVKRRITSDSSILFAEIKKNTEGTGLLRALSDTVVKNENVGIDDLMSEFDLGSQILRDMPQAYEIPKAKTAADSPNASEYDDISQFSGSDETSEDNKKKPKKIGLKVRINRLLYDYSELEQEELEENVADLINRDGYYNEVVPIDEGMEYDDKRNGVDKRVIAVLAALFVVSGIIVYMFRSMF